MLQKNIYIILIVLFFSVGCVNERIIEDSTFYSPRSPKIKIKIDSKFLHIDDITETKTIQYDAMDSSGLERTETFIFGMKGMKNELTKGVIITLAQINRGYYFNDPFQGMPSEVKLKYEMKKINEKSYHQCIFPSTFIFNTTIRDAVYEQGYIIPNCFLMKVLSRKYSGDDKQMYVYYFEDISNFGRPNIYECFEWIGINKLKEDQKKRLDDFINASHTNIQFVE